MKRALILCLLISAAAFAQENRTGNQPTSKSDQLSRSFNRPASSSNQTTNRVNLPTSKTLAVPAPGRPQRTNSFPTAMAVSPDGNWLALLNNGYGTAESKGQQSIAILDLRTNELKDFPDARLGRGAAQTYFLGMAWSSDGRRLYASMASITDPLGEKQANTGNGIAVYAFQNGALTPERFIKIPLQTLAAGKKFNKIGNVPEGKAIPYPAGIAVVGKGAEEKLLVADNLSDDVLLIEASTGKIIHRFDLSTSEHVPASYPYGVVADGRGRAYVSLWNESSIAEVDLNRGQVVRMISVRKPKSRAAVGSHPSAMAISRGGEFLYATLSNTDEVAVIDTRKGRVERYLSTRLANQKHGGSYPNAIALNGDRTRLFVANASSDAVAVFGSAGREAKLLGFIPTEWYPTALAVHNDDLLIATGKGQGTGPNSAIMPETTEQSRNRHPYIPSLIHGSVARVNIAEAEKTLSQLTAIAEDSNFQQKRQDEFERDGERMARLPNQQLFAGRKNPIRHVIYIIKENRTYDQLFGDIEGADGDPSLVMYGEDITPNQHALARQFGILDNFYDSGEISGNGHVWSTAAITSDYTEKTWEINYRGRERTYDYEGGVSNAIPMEQGISDVNEPGTGYLWANMARNKKTYRHYGEYILSRWCNEFPKEPQSPTAGTPLAEGARCERTFVRKGEELVSGAKREPSPYPWPVPILARNDATKPELRGHFDPMYADFRMDYPDQLRADEFLKEFAGYVKAREQKKGREQELPEFVVMRLPNDHTSGTRANTATPAAAVADNDLAVGRVVEAVSHSPYWDDTAIFVLEDDAQDGADHVDAHRSIALVISKYAPKGNTQRTQRSAEDTEKKDSSGSPVVPSSSVAPVSSVTDVQPFVDHTFYTTVNVIHTMEALLGVPAMNNNDARAVVMSPLFNGDGSQPAFKADYRNRDNGLIYEMNRPNAPGAKESAAMDFTHADSVDTAVLNAILWRDRKGDAPMPKPVHTMCGRDQ